MSSRTTQIMAGVCLACVAAIPFAVARTPGIHQDQGKALAIVRTGSSVTVDDKYLYVLGGGQIVRIDKATGAASGTLTPTGWAGEAAPAGGGGAGTATTGG